jgi:hypothetical protein
VPNPEVAPAKAELTLRINAIIAARDLNQTKAG